MDATPAADLVMVQAQFFLSLAKATFDRPKATRSRQRSVMNLLVTGFRSPGTRLDKKYFTSPVNTLSCRDKSVTLEFETGYLVETG